ncbi:hypothetical protein UlMin_035478 [Ulmus minor]
MKHLLRKLHIGERLPDARPVISPNSNPDLPGSSTASPASTSSSAAMGRIATVESVGDRTAGDAGSGECVDFNFLEEEFQVQLALAISASDPDAREGSESSQIDAAKQISLGCSASVTDSRALVDILSLNYWSYNVVNYNDKVVDGFYDVYAISSNSFAQGKMPLRAELQVMSVSDNADYEVILVDRMVDHELRRLEKKADDVSKECRFSEHGLILSGLVQKIANIVVKRMGGPVGDADELTRKWTNRRNELRSSLNTVLLPLGHLDVGLSRHRALLFKVLADRINLPCMLVKGSYYTGTDDGAVNLIKVENGSEYIIDLMGAPGTLIPSEVPSSQLPSSFLDIRSFADVTVMPTGFSMLHDGGIEMPALPNVGSLGLDEASYVDTLAKDERCLVEENQSERCENEFEKSLPLLSRSFQSLEGTSERASSAQKKKVKNVSKYVISAAKNPEFAQKLHAVLLESGASPPPDLFTDMCSQDLDEDRVVRVGNKKIASDGIQYLPDNLVSHSEHSLIPCSGGVCSNYSNIDYGNKGAVEGLAEKQNELGTYMLVGNGTSELIQNDLINVNMPPANPPYTRNLLEEPVNKLALPFEANSCQRHPETASVIDDQRWFQDTVNMDLGKESASNLLETTCGYRIGCDSQSMLGEVSEWEIPWEDLRIGERIGIGSYGEVYHADWNGTEVAVKKFLDQDVSGDALVQFKCEVEIMLRLRHPNVVLFMGAVTRSPHFSILTEYLPRGSLYRLLHRPNFQLDEKRRLRMALDVAKGMNYLHISNPTIVHRDLKSPNLLVDKNWVVKVCDFGLSRLKHHTFLSSKSTAGTPEWMAPEVLRNEPANEKCDVYSFGVILWELATCRIPWKGLNPMQVVGAVGFQNKRLEIPEDIHPEVAQIIHDCWQREPNLRPSFTQLMVRIKGLQHLLVEKTSISSIQTAE